MASLQTKFGLGDVFYTFNSDLGEISRFSVSSVSVASNLSNRTLITYTTTSGSKHYEYDAMSADEVREIANAWLLEKSISIFSNVGL